MGMPVTFTEKELSSRELLNIIWELLGCWDQPFASGYLIYLNPHLLTSFYPLAPLFGHPTYHTSPSPNTHERQVKWFAKSRNHSSLCQLTLLVLSWPCLSFSLSILTLSPQNWHLLPQTCPSVSLPTLRNSVLDTYAKYKYNTYIKNANAGANLGILFDFELFS